MKGGRKRKSGMSTSVYLVKYILIGKLNSNDELTRILNRVVDVGIRGGWSQLDDTPLREAKVRVPSEQIPPTESPMPHPEQFSTSDTS